MASTAIHNEEEKKEFFDSPEELDAKVTMLAEMIITSQHMTAFTGAGISTASGIPDYRSGYNTVLNTGPGCWETAANKQKYAAAVKAGDKNAKMPANKATLKTAISKAYPSKTHMAMVELTEKQHLKYVISQNVDGLHRKSGIPPENLAELHGNTNLEVCMECGREHMRDFGVRNSRGLKEHRTGRKCDTPSCQGDLKDTIINFGENLNDNILELGFQNCGASDLCLVMGTSLRVTPAADMPKTTAANGGNLIICNLQKTPLDNYATLCIYAKCDDIMELLMKKLGYQIPSWQKKARVNVELSKNGKELEIMGVDSNGAPYSLFTDVKVSGLEPNKTTPILKPVMPWRVQLPAKKPESFDIHLKFQGHYNEPDMKLKVNMAELEANTGIEYMMIYDAAKTQKWEIVVMTNKDKDVIGTADFTQGGKSAVVAKPAPVAMKPV